MEPKFLKELSPYQLNLNSRIFNLVIGRVLKRAYLSFDEKGKETIERIFLSDDSGEKENFIKKYVPNFKKLFKEEAKKVEGEIKLEIEKQI